jgi:diguanylate cyclase (GGDEF)-like protein
MSALMLDIDHFKQVNDRYGHAAGDDVIRAVAARLQGVIRTMDIIGRYGGEEFALVLPETGETATVLGERLRTAIEDTPITTCEGEISVTISVGHALMDASDTELADTLNRADAALYEAKRQGRNRVVSAPPPTPVRHIEAA